MYLFFPRLPFYIYIEFDSEAEANDNLSKRFHNGVHNGPVSDVSRSFSDVSRSLTRERP